MFNADFINLKENKKYGKYLETLEEDQILELLTSKHSKSYTKNLTQADMLKKLLIFNKVAQRIPKELVGYIQQKDGIIGELEEGKLVKILASIRKYFIKRDVLLDLIYQIYNELDTHINYKKMILLIKNGIDGILNGYAQKSYDILDGVTKGDFKTHFPNFSTKFEILTNKEVLDTFLNGYYFHEKEEYVKRFEQWNENPLIRGTYETILSNFLPYFIGHILMFKSINELVIINFDSKRFVLDGFDMALDSIPINRIVSKKDSK